VSAWEAGRAVGPYVLIDRIGAGGMGEVWKARDPRLDRMVALKRLRVRSDAFEREARTIAALNHPHICTLHDIGADYLVMEHIEGVPLSGPLDVDEAVRLALQIAAALEAAHSRGIVHRDLKPANVLVTGGRAKLVDFGIAKLHRATADATMTIEGQIAGTPAYMSPEQAQGQDTDARSDIFSFGAVLYEMLSGRRAFDAASTAATLSAVLRDEPAPARMPDSLARIIRRCLEKSPGQRFQTVAELRAALEHLSEFAPSATPPPPPASVAVLPFANLSSDPEQEYFSDGLTEEIINLLARINGLKVIARTSAFAFKGRSLPVGQIAEALGVTSILEGSVRRAGSRIRVTAQLINAADGSHRWSERYDREMADVFALQDDIASAIVSELRGRLAGPAPAPRAYTPTVPAYEAYLMARHLVWAKHSAEGFAQGRELYQRAIALDPGYALPHAGLAELYHICASMRGDGAREAAALIRPAAEQALALDPSLPEAHMWRGILTSTYEHDWVGAAASFARAMVSLPAPLLRHMHAYFYLRFVNRADEAVAEHRVALQEDPLNLIIRVGLVLSLYSAGRLREAADEAHRLLELAPDFTASYGLHVLNVLIEPPAAARAFAEHLYAVMPRAAGSVGLLAGVLRRGGDEAGAAALMRDVADREEYGNAVDHALYELVAGDMDRAFDAMATLVEQRHPFLTMVVVGGPYGALLRSSPRWPSFVRTIGMPSSP
jgi:TolB-like protein/predicted Ser/Thr protein kinase